MKTLIKGGLIVNDDTEYKADIILSDDTIENIIIEGTAADEISGGSFDVVIDATDCVVMPGVIDTHVHFREPGLTHKADMHTESKAAACGGVTSVFEMPNTVPQTTTQEAFEDKHRLAADGRMHVNYTFFPGATNDNAEWLKSLDPTIIPGIKLFMGSSTGNMLVDQEEALNGVFKLAHDLGLVVMAHCEDTAIINQNMQRYKEQYDTDDPSVELHYLIRSEEACLRSSALAVELARKHDTKLHIAHVSTAKELQLQQEGDKVTLEATVAHLLFTNDDYSTLGTRIKCNPSIKTDVDRKALRLALNKDGVGGIHTIGTDHAPHLLNEKQGGATKAVSGMPSVQWSLISMLQLVDEGVLSLPRVARLMSHNPATLFGVEKRGFIRKGYKADIAIVKRDNTPWVLTDDMVVSKCGWSPLTGRQFNWHVAYTVLNGEVIYDNGRFDDGARGSLLRFTV